MLSSITAKFLLVSCFYSTLARAQFVGGYALRFDGPCPEEMVDCGATGIFRDRNHACCPTGQVCNIWRTNIHGCCADQSNCYDQAVSSNVCADDSWVLYERGSRGNAFCCANGQVGRSTTGNNGRAICVNPGTPVGRNDAELNVQPQGSRDLLLASRSSGAPATSTPAPGGSSSSMSEEPTVSAPGGSPSVPPSSDVPRQTSTGTDSMDISSPAGTSMTSTGANPTETTSAGTQNRVLKNYLLVQIPLLLLALYNY